MKVANTPASGTRDCKPKPYQTPRLTLFGDVGTLTETGSMVSMEDLIQNGMCSNFLGQLNMTGNMC